MPNVLVLLAVLLAPALALAAPPVVTIEAGALRVTADELPEEHLDVAATLGDGARVAALEARLVVVKQAYAARGQDLERVEVRVMPEAPLAFVQRVLHTLDVAGVARTEPLLDGAPLFPVVKAERSCAARARPCAEPRIVVAPEGLRAVLRYGTRDRRGVCAERGKPGPAEAPVWAGRMFPEADAPPLDAKALVRALASEKQVRACPKATVRPARDATAGNVRSVVKALRAAGYRDVVVEVLPPDA